MDPVLIVCVGGLLPGDVCCRLLTCRVGSKVGDLWLRAVCCPEEPENPTIAWQAKGTMTLGRESRDVFGDSEATLKKCAHKRR